VSGHGRRQAARSIAALAAATAALTAAALTAASSLPTPAVADPIGHCSTTTGTIVAVDFAHWGGPLVRGCGVNSSSGYTLLHAAGFSTAGDSSDGPAIICRLGNPAFDDATPHPTPAEDPCTRTPSSSADWSYWTAVAGHHSWTYSSLGAMSDHPKPGEVELWTFGSISADGSSGTGVPTASPDSLRAHNAATPAGRPSGNPAPTPTTARSAGGSAPSAVPSPGRRAGQLATGQRSRTSPARTSMLTRPHRTRRDHHTAVPTTSPGTTVSGSPGPTVVAALPAAEHRAAASSGSSTALLVGLGLALLIAAAAGLTAWRRRQAE
jgi:hypothetical protein